MELAALIVAAGVGERARGGLPKQYRMLGGMPVLRRTLLSFLNNPKIGAVQVAIHKDHRTLYDEAVAGLSLLPPMIGGASRQESVYYGLQALAAHAPRKVLVHDAARPFLSGELLARVADALGKETAVIPALPIADTLKRIAGDQIVETLARETMVRVQTPQGFDFKLLMEAHEKLRGQNFSDDAAVMEAAGHQVTIVAGEEKNRKLTVEEDFAMGMETRSAQGFDVHGFTEAKGFIRLCGIEIPDCYKLEGHSDADVALHALTDAILGLIAEGDIGIHFSPDNPRWKDANSEIFLAHALKLLAEKGGKLRHVDLTIIGEQPKISPYRDAMREKLAAMLHLPLSHVSLKATTTEQLGFLGRREGLAALAMATGAFPWS